MYLQETPQKGESKVVKGSENPEFKHTVKLQVERSSRVFKRVAQSKTLKVEVFYRR